MAKVHNNVVVRGLKGLFGDQLVLKTDKAGRTIVSNKPVFASNRIFTPAQQAQQERFRAARAYARSTRDLEIYKAKAEGTPRTPSNIAMTDWFHPPEIREIDLSEWTGQARQPIRIRAVDDVQVKQVSVVIMNEHDAVLEQGPATVEDDGWWTYQTRMTVAGKPKVLVAAEDLPGHVTQMVKSLN